MTRQPPTCHHYAEVTMALIGYVITAFLLLMIGQIRRAMRPIVWG